MAREAYRAAAEVVRVAAEVSPRRRSSRNGGDRRGQQQAGQGRRRHPGIVGENETMQVGGCSRIRRYAVSRPCFPRRPESPAGLA